MLTFDAIVVGGGPAGSTCAGALRRAGWHVAVLDRARFPRDKVCAGWVTPGVFTLLGLTPADYGAAGHVIQEIRAFRTGTVGARAVDTRYDDVVSYAIRRCEFDTFLLRRAGAQVFEGTAVSGLRRTPDQWIVNDAFAAPFLVAAGGHFCPVARHLRGGHDTAQPVVAKEVECLAADVGPRSATLDRPELFFSDDLQGYGWIVPKQDYVNVGIGRRSPAGFNAQWEAFVTTLATTHGLTGLSDATWHGHAYLAQGAGARPLVGPGVIAVGDAAGLAYPESGEGIRPAVESGLLAASALRDAHERHVPGALAAYATALMRQHPHVRPPAPWLARATAAAGRRLLRSKAFTRHVLLDRWFLRSKAA